MTKRYLQAMEYAAEQRQTAATPGQEAVATPPPGTLAARCPPGWRRDPMTGRPVMPCLGKLLFPCAPDEVPTFGDIVFQLKRVWPGDGDVFYLAYAVLTSAAGAKRRRGECMQLCDESAVSNAVDAALRAQGTVRIRRTAGGWEEVADA